MVNKYLAIIFIFVFPCFNFGQDSLKVVTPDSTLSDSLKISSLNSALFNKTDTLSLRLSYPAVKQLPKNIIPMPKLTGNPLEIDTRTGSYYTPRNVQDKMDQIMNRPRRDSFVPVMAMAVFAASIAAKQLEIEKLFELSAKDYFVSDHQFSILEKLWAKAPRRIDDLYLSTDLKNETTAKELQKNITILTEKSLIKTRDAGENNILFYPAQKSEKVIDLFKSAINDPSNSKETNVTLKNLLERLQKIVSAKHDQ